MSDSLHIVVYEKGCIFIKYISFSDLLLKSGSASLAFFLQGITSNSALQTHRVYLHEDCIKSLKLTVRLPGPCQIPSKIILHCITPAALHCFSMLTYPQWKQGLTKPWPGMNVSYATGQQSWGTKEFIQKISYSFWMAVTCLQDLDAVQ